MNKRIEVVPHMDEVIVEVTDDVVIISQANSYDGTKDMISLHKDWIGDLIDALKAALLVPAG